jgi:hypothetical protein
MELVQVRTMVAVDPEAFGVDDPYEPRLGCATTGQLLTELYARLDECVVESALLDGVVTNTVAWYVTRIRERLSGEQLAYRTIDS